MFKLVVLLAALLAVNAVPLNEIFELINEERTCPEYGGMKDIDTLKLLGVWYDLAYSEAQGNPSHSCVKITLARLENGTITLDQTQTLVDGSTGNEPTSYFETEEDEPGDLFRVGSENRDSPWSIIYTDYDNIAVFFRCVVYEEDWIPIAEKKFFIAIKERGFNKLDDFLEGIGSLARLGIDLNELRFFYQGENCKN